MVLFVLPQTLHTAWWHNKTKQCISSIFLHSSLGIPENHSPGIYLPRNLFHLYVSISSWYSVFSNLCRFSLLTIFWHNPIDLGFTLQLAMATEVFLLTVSQTCCAVLHPTVLPTQSHQFKVFGSWAAGTTLQQQRLDKVLPRSPIPHP